MGRVFGRDRSGIEYMRVGNDDPLPHLLFIVEGERRLDMVAVALYF